MCVLGEVWGVGVWECANVCAWRRCVCAGRGVGRRCVGVRKCVCVCVCVEEEDVYTHMCVCVWVICESV